MRLVWAQHALADRIAIFDRLESDSPRAAVEVDDRIGAALRRLLDFPERAVRGASQDVNSTTCGSAGLRPSRWRRPRTNGRSPGPPGASTRKRLVPIAKV